jgi:serine/threonine protein kinase
MSSEIGEEISEVAGLSPRQASDVINILDRYLGELEQGRPSDPEELVARHPELGEVLRAHMEKLEALHRAADSLRGPVAGVETSAAACHLPERGRLGDFMILREVGRGGMGIVYEAEQISLGRRVALKVLPFASALDDKQLRRFKSEAQAAAHLHHTHIVPVFAVGSERGVHYYSMQFIDGQSLAAMIAELRQLEGLGHTDGQLSHSDLGVSLVSPPSTRSEIRPHLREDTAQAVSKTTITRHSSHAPSFFRTVAELGVQAAEALEHAHQMGIVHRDIKPANLMVEGQGHLWITDFGLARYQSEGGLTVTGDLLGTLRYMSPEQALGKRCQVDHRSDIYSLGVTLYEMLTLEPAYPGRDRQELLRQLSFDDPIGPRRIDASIPVELETIVLKAIAKEPETRYATAQELGEDLRRFLENKPILASRPTLVERGRKWARRHRPAVMGGIVLLMLATAGLSASSILIWQEKQRTEDALKAQMVEHAKAIDVADQARQRSALADESFRQLRNAITEIVHGMDDKRWAGEPRIDEVRQAMTEKLFVVFKDLLREDAKDPFARFEAGKAYMLMANIDRVQGSCDKAREKYKRAIELFKGLTEDKGLTEVFKNECGYGGELAMAYNTLGAHYASSGDDEEARENLKQADTQYALAIRKPCPCPTVLNNYAWFLVICPEKKLRNPSRAVELACAAVSGNIGEGLFRNTLGVAYYRVGKWDRAIDTLKESVKLRGDKSDGFDWFFLAMAYWQKGNDEKDEHAKQKAKEEAHRWYWKAVRNLADTNIYTEPIWPHCLEASALLEEDPPAHEEKDCRRKCPNKRPVAEVDRQRAHLEVGERS